MNKSTKEAIYDAYDGKAAEALMEYAERCGASYQKGYYLPRVFEDTTNVDECVETMIEEIAEDECRENEELEEMRKYFVQQAYEVNGCIVIDNF